MGRYGMDSYGSRLGQVASCCKHGNKYSGFIKRKELLDQLRNN
jgi:hypothetical protein